MAPHSSTLAWKIPWVEELVGCSPWGHEELDTTERPNNVLVLLTKIILKTSQGPPGTRATHFANC